MGHFAPSSEEFSLMNESHEALKVPRAASSTYYDAKRRNIEKVKYQKQ